MVTTRTLNLGALVGGTVHVHAATKLEYAGGQDCGNAGEKAARES